MAKYEKGGGEPVAIPVGFKRPETLAEQVQRLVRTHISREAAEQGMETFEEAEDFDIEDEDFDPSSPYEEVFDPVLGRGITLDEFRRNEAVYRERHVKAELEAYKVMEASEALRVRPKPQKGVQGDPPAPSSEGTPKAPTEAPKA